jgi:hypothetical protein
VPSIRCDSEVPTRAGKRTQGRLEVATEHMGKLIPRRGILIGPGQQSRRRQVCDSPDGCTTVYSHRCDLVLQASIGNQRRSQKGLCVKEADMSSVSRLTCRNHPLHASVTSLREARNRSRGDPRRQYQLEMLRTQVAHVVLDLMFRMWQYFCKEPDGPTV